MTDAPQSQAAPAPDYASGLGAEAADSAEGVEVCSCDEALALRARVRELEAEKFELGCRVARLEAFAQPAREAMARLDRSLAELPGDVATFKRVVEGLPRRIPAVVSATLAVTPSARTRNGWSSRHKGVYWHTKSARWRARVLVGGKRVSLGAFTTESEAARAVECALRGAGASRG